VIASVGELEQDEQNGRSHPMLVTPTESPLDERLAGADVRLTVEAAATEGEVLVVPLTAVYNGADGNTAVLKLLPGGTQQRITVTAGVSGDGFVAVTPVDGALQAGDLVVVGAGGSL
jgi:multidrug efflux pump subunit AcrA (membrane-fusion protein)